MRVTGALRDAELRKQEFGNLVGFFEMRIAGSYDDLDAERLIFA